MKLYFISCDQGSLLAWWNPFEKTPFGDLEGRQQPKTSRLWPWETSFNLSSQVTHVFAPFIHSVLQQNGYHQEELNTFFGQIDTNTSPRFVLAKYAPKPWRWHQFHTDAYVIQILLQSNEAVGKFLIKILPKNWRINLSTDNVVRARKSSHCHHTSTEVRLLYYNYCPTTSTSTFATASSPTTRHFTPTNDKLTKSTFLLQLYQINPNDDLIARVGTEPRSLLATPGCSGNLVFRDTGASIKIYKQKGLILN